MSRPVYLASRSARRREILAQMGLRYEMLILREGPTRAHDFDEAPHQGETAAQYVERVARLKAEVGWLRMNQRRLMKLPILSADTTVALDDEIIGKPADKAQATDILRRLSGRDHEVLTAVAVKVDERVEVAISVSRVTFKELDDAAIRNYVATGEPMDKAGAYGIQGKASLFVKHLSGSYSGVVGLPIYETAELLSHFGVTIL
ncbi:MAG: septum formation inhibitor Maf [Burkholderiales bacterium]|nr:septum formation inhibitor Maf [Burkholderiales bacterium]